MSGRPRPRSHPYPRLGMAAKNRRDTLDMRRGMLNRLRMFIRDCDPDRLAGRDVDSLADDDIYAIANAGERAQIDQWKPLEAAMERELLREFKKHPLHEWAKKQRGIGAGVLMALLIADLEPFGRFDNIAKVWQYCGHGDPKRSTRRKGVKTEYNPTLKTTCHLIGKSIVKSGAGGEWRAMYDDRKAQERAKPWCGQCSPKSAIGVLDSIGPLLTETAERAKAELKPKCTMPAPREHCTDGHAEAKARHYVVKQLLAELWLEAHARGAGNVST